MDRESKFLLFQTAQGNEIWMPNLALAWKKYEKLTNFQVSCPEESKICKQIIESLTKTAYNDQDLDESSYFESGMGPETSLRINQILQQKYSSNFSQPPRATGARNSQVILYAATHKVLRFEHPFYRIPNKIMHFCKEKIPCFEPLQAEQRGQILVIKYASQDNFMVRMDPADKSESVFLIRSQDKVTLEEALSMVEKAKEDLKPITKSDVFKIPVIRISASRVINELNQCKVNLPNDKNKYSFGSLIESVSLEISSQPMKDRMEDVTLTVDEQMSMKSRRMVCRGPFWLIFKHKNRKPYLAIFVRKASQNREGW